MNLDFPIGKLFGIPIRVHSTPLPFTREGTKTASHHHYALRNHHHAYGDLLLAYVWVDAVQ